MSYFQIGTGRGGNKVMKTFIGLSTDTKPSDAGIGFGSILFEQDVEDSYKVSKIYRYVPDSNGNGTLGWVEDKSTGFIQWD